MYFNICTYMKDSEGANFDETPNSIICIIIIMTNIEVCYMDH